jgi:hypothetical protein
MDEWTPEAVTVLIGSVSSVILNIVQAIRRGSAKADANDALLTLARSMSREIDNCDRLERARDEAVKASTRKGSERAIDSTMELVLSESMRGRIGL